MRRRARNAVLAGGMAATVVIVALATSGPSALPQSASATDEPIVLRVGTTVDLITDNPFAVAAGSDWSVVTAPVRHAAEVRQRVAVPRAEPRRRAASRTAIRPCGRARSARVSSGATARRSRPATSRSPTASSSTTRCRSTGPTSRSTRRSRRPTIGRSIWTSEEPTFAPDMPPWAYIVPETVWKGVDGKGLAEIKAQPNTPSIAAGRSRSPSGARDRAGRWSRTRTSGARSRRSTASSSASTPTRRR